MKKYIISLLLVLLLMLVDYFQSISSIFDMMDKMSTAVRSFTSTQLFNDKIREQQFPLNVPSHNAIAIMGEFSDDSSSYHEVSLNPTNLSNLANEKQMVFIQKIAKDKLDKYTNFDFLEMKFYQYRPIYITNESCLQCHSLPSLAPKVQLEMYGVDNGYGYKLGDLYGIKFFSLDAKLFVLKYVVLFIILIYSYSKIRKVFRNTIIPMLYVDKGTGAYNKNYYLKFKNKPFLQGYLFVIDIDNFKHINDNYGHDFGDIVLSHIVKTIKELVRENDLLFRVGGEEFVLFISGIDEVKSMCIANMINTNIAQQILQYNNSDVTFTVSIGITYKPKVDLFDEAFKRADSALYYVKRNGKNNYKLNNGNRSSAPTC